MGSGLKVRYMEDLPIENTLNRKHFRSLLRLKSYKDIIRLIPRVHESRINSVSVYRDEEWTRREVLVNSPSLGR